MANLEIKQIGWIAAFVAAAIVSIVQGAEPAAPSREPIKAFCIDFNWGPGGINGFAGPGVWADASPQQHVDWYHALGCNVIQTFAISCNGYAWYKGGIVPPQPGLKHDFLTEVVRLGHQRQMRVMAYFCVASNTRWGQQHPDLSYGTPSDPHIPFTTKYLDDLGSWIEDALTKTGMDGFMIDWVWNPGEIGSRPLRWLECEKQMYQELMGEPFPGKEKLTPQRDLEFRRRAIDRCWQRIRQSAKRANPQCVIWLSCCNVAAPSVVNSPMFREVDWLMNEATDPASLAAVEKMIGPQTRLVQCVVGWGDQHDARSILAAAGARDLGIYGFAKPGPSSLPLPVAQYQGKNIACFQGNDRNIAVLARHYNDQPMDLVTRQGPDGRVLLGPETANVHGTSPVIAEGQIGHWANPTHTVSWLVELTRPGTFEVKLTSACARQMGGSKFSVEIGDKVFSLLTEETGPAGRDYTTRSLGTVTLPAGKHTLSIRPSAEPKWKSLSVKAVELLPR